MYYDRTLKNGFATLLEKGGALRWLFEFVRNHEELDFLIGRNSSSQWISVYRGLTRIITIKPRGAYSIFVDAANKYKCISTNLYGIKSIYDNFQTEIESLLIQIKIDCQFDRYFKNGKEGYFQNELSRRYGICGNENDDFVIIDKEAVIGYKGQEEKSNLLGNIREKYKQLQEEISKHYSKDYGKDLKKKPIGNELDFLALDKKGNILLIEYKHGTNTSGIYLSPLQIGLYYEIFTNYPREKLVKVVLQMLCQKQKIGLINPNWTNPDCIKDIIPVLIISKYNEDSCAKVKYENILNITRQKNGLGFLSNIQTFNYTSEIGLSKW
jgi:hypothetical protein